MIWRLWVMICVGLGMASCNRPPARIGGGAKHPTVASLVPGATDLILGMGARDHLVGVSNFDVERDGTRDLPRVGDYQGIDWEKISAIKPDILIVFMAPDRMPEGLRQRAANLGVKLVNVKTERIADIYNELKNLGEMLGEKQKAQGEIDSIRARLEAVKKSVEGMPRIRVLVAREQNASAVVGKETFIDDALEIAGGVNVVQTTGWPEIDRERLAALRPEAIVQLLPGSSKVAQKEMREMWGRMRDLPAVRDNRVYILDQWWTEQSGAHIADLAEELASVLHPSSVGGRP